MHVYVLHVRKTVSTYAVECYLVHNPPYNTTFILVVKNTYNVTVRNFQTLQVCKQPVFKADFVKCGGGA